MPSVSLIKGDKMEFGGVDYRDAIPVNMYAVLKPVLNSAGYLYQMLGLTTFGTGSGIDRDGIWSSASNFEGHYRVSGTNLVSLDASGVETVLGTIPGTGQVSIDFSFNNVLIAAEGNLYYYNNTDGFRQITDTDESVVGNPIAVAFVAQFIVLTDGVRIYHSNIVTDITPENEEIFPLDNEAVAEFTPDTTLSVRKNEDNELMVFGSGSTENFVFNPNFSSGFAFQPLDGKASTLGVSGSFSMCELEGKWYVLGRRAETAPSCYLYYNGSAQKIASREIEQVLDDYTDDELSTTTMDCLTIDKVKLVFYHFPNETYLYNASVAESQGVDNAWSLVKTGTGNENYRARNFVRDPRIGKWIVGDKLDSRIGLFDKTVATQYGDIAEFLIYSPFLNLETLSINNIELQTIPGIVDSSQDATVFVSRTENGRTYGQEASILYGDQYNYNQRFRPVRMGYVRHWTGFKFRGASRSRMAFGLFDVEAS